MILLLATAYVVIGLVTACLVTFVGAANNWGGGTGAEGRWFAIVAGLTWPVGWSVFGVLYLWMNVLPKMRREVGMRQAVLDRKEREALLIGHGECCDYVAPGTDRCGVVPEGRNPQSSSCTRPLGHGTSHYDAVESLGWDDVGEAVG